MLPFGKYKGQQLKNIFDKDKRYIEWLVTTPWYNEKFHTYFEESKLLIREYNHNIILNDDITIYTDGSCAFNGMKGATCGIGIHFSETNRNKLNDVSQLLDVEKPTNNFAELCAIDKAIQIIIDKKLTKNNDKHSIGNDRADNLARKSVYEHLNQPKKIPNGQL